MARILFVTRSAEAGGVEEHVFQLSRRARRDGHRVAWMVLEGGLINSRFAAAPIRFVRPPAGGRLPRPVAELLALTAAVRRLRPDVVHAHGPRACLLAGVATRLSAKRVRLVSTMHASLALNAMDDRGRVSRLRRWGNRAVHHLNYFLSAHYLAVSDSLRREMSPRGRTLRKLEVIPNGVVLHRLPETLATRAELLARCPAFDCAAFNLVCVGRLDPKKGQEVLVQAVSGILEASQPIACHFIGEGYTRRALEAECRRLGLVGRTFFWGHVDDAWRFLPWFSAFVLPTFTEGQGLAVLEAMAASLPVVATNVGGVPESLGADAGLLVPPGDAAALRNAIVRLRDDAGLREDLRRAALRRAGLFDLERTTRAVVERYRLPPR